MKTHTHPLCLGAALSLMLMVALLALPPSASMAETGIAGSWGGTISAGEFSFGASVTFSAGGSYSIRAGGLSSSGSYRASGSSITLSPSSPPGFNTTTLSLSLSEDGNRATISGTINGLRGTLSLRRSSTTPGKNALYARWQAQSDEALITLEVYEGGWIYWHESYEKGLNTRLLRHIREGIVDGTLHETGQILTLIDSTPLWLEFGGKLSLDGKTLKVSPLSEPSSAAPSLWLPAHDDKAGAWQFETEVDDGKLILRIGKNDLVFDRLGDSPVLPEKELFRASVTLKPGDKGELVILLQHRLAQLGLLSIEADGVYGKQTKEAVRAFEAQHGLPDDGEADPAVLRLLYAEPED